MKWRTCMIAVMALLIVVSVGQVVFSQATSTPAPDGPKKLSGFAADRLTASQFGGPSNVPFERDPFIVSNIRVLGFMSGPYIDLTQTDPNSGCTGVFAKTPTYAFNLEEPLKTLSIRFENQDSNTQAWLVVRMPDGSFYCSGALTNSPAVTISGNTTSSSVTIWVGVPLSDYADGSLSISQQAPPSESTNTTAQTSTAVPIANNPVQSIVYDIPVHGVFGGAGGKVVYSLAGVKNDVVEALLTSVTPQGAPMLLSPQIFVNTVSGAIIVDPHQSGYKSGGRSVVASDAGTINQGSFVFQVPQDGPITLTLQPDYSQEIGSFNLILLRIPVLDMDKTVTATVNYKALAAGQPVGLYAFTYTGSFSLEYHVTGTLNLTAMINQTQTNGYLRPVSFLGSQSLDGSAPKNNPAFQGGTLDLMGSGQVFVISIGNAILSYDDPLASTASASDTDSATYQLIIHTANGTS